VPTIGRASISAHLAISAFSAAIWDLRSPDNPDPESSRISSIVRYQISDGSAITPAVANQEHSPKLVKPLVACQKHLKLAFYGVRAPGDILTRLGDQLLAFIRHFSPVDVRVNGGVGQIVLEKFDGRLWLLNPTGADISMTVSDRIPYLHRNSSIYAINPLSFSE